MTEHANGAKVDTKLPPGGPSVGRGLRHAPKGKTVQQPIGSKKFTSAKPNGNLDSEVDPTEHLNGGAVKAVQPNAPGTEDVVSIDDKEEEREEEEGDGETGDDIIPAGRVDKDGNVVDDDGNIVGRVASGFSQKLCGNVVDLDGDVLDDEGNVVAKAEPIDSVKDATEQDASVSQKLDQPADATTTDGQEDEEQAQKDVSNGQKLDQPADTAAESQKGDELAQKDAIGSQKLDQPVDTTEGGQDDDEQSQKDTVGSQKLDQPADVTAESQKGEEQAQDTIDDQKLDQPAGVTAESQKGEEQVQDTVDGQELDQPADVTAESQKGEEQVQDTIDGQKLDQPADVTAESQKGEEQVQDTVDGQELDQPADVTAESQKGEEQAQDTVDGQKLDQPADINADDQKDATDDQKSIPGPGSEIEQPDISGQEAPSEKDTELPDISILEGKKVNKAGNIVDDNGNVFGRLIEGNPKTLLGNTVDAEGKIWNNRGKVIGQAEVLPEAKLMSIAPFEDFPNAVVDENGKVLFEGKVVGVLVEGDPKKLAGKNVDADGDVLDKNGNVLGKAERPKDEEPQAEETPDYSILAGKKLNKGGYVVDESGNPFGRLIEGDAKKLAGKPVDAEGKIWDDSGKVIGRAEVLPEVEKAQLSPFEDFDDAVVDKSGKILSKGKQIGVVVEGDPKKLAGKRVDADGDILDKYGNVIGKAERQDEEEPQAEEIDCSILAGKRVNKAGNVVDNTGAVFGRVTEGDFKHLIGKKVDAKGNIYGDSGAVIGSARPIPEDEREPPTPAPFEDFPNAVVDKTGNILFQGAVIGKLKEGDAKKLAGKQVDADGDVVDKNGNVLGKAERWEEEEAPPEVVDMSILAGKRVNKAGNIVDSHGDIYGRLIEGDVTKLAGKMCDKNGNIRNEAGDIVGKAELVPEGDREAKKEGPFADFPGSTVSKDGKILDTRGEVVGRLTEGDAKKLYGKTVDEDGDVVDRNGNVLGKAERWVEEEAKKDVNPMSGRKVNRQGNVVDENGDVIGKLTDGDVLKCAGKSIDDDGDVVDQKNKVIGHVTLLENIPPEPEPEPEPEAVAEPDPEEVEQKRKLEEDRKLAGQMATCIEQSIDKIRPILKMITDTLEKADRTPKDELDEEELVKTVKPLIEEGGRILQEANGVIRGLDPDGRISANAKHKTAAREASPEEYRLADLLKELTTNVTQTIENGKKKIEGMPHAKKELNPLWGLLSEPLFQILAAVGLLLSGVLGLVGKLLNGLGLGGLVNNLLGGLGITKVLDGLGLGSILSPITGAKKKK